jgi:hypothetical protein
VLVLREGRDVSGELAHGATGRIVAGRQHVSETSSVIYTVRIHCEDSDVPFWAEVDEHPALTVFGRELGELFENLAEGIGSLE